MNASTSLVDLLNNPLAVIVSIITIISAFIAIYRYGRKHINFEIELTEPRVSNIKIPTPKTSNSMADALINTYFDGPPKEIYEFTYRYYVKITAEKNLKLKVIAYHLDNYELHIKSDQIELKEKQGEELEFTRKEQTKDYQIPDTNTSSFELTLHYKTFLIFNHYIIYKNQKTIQVREL
jgi:hypothetical protein